MFHRGLRIHSPIFNIVGASFAPHEQNEQIEPLGTRCSAHIIGIRFHNHTVTAKSVHSNDFNRKLFEF